MSEPRAPVGASATTESRERAAPSEPRVVPALEEVDWQDFRDHLATADREGHRTWLYPKQPRGWYYTLRIYFSYLLLFVMFAGPFARIHGNPLLLFNLVDRKFVIFGRIFWPQDAALFALATLLYLTAICVFTAAFGRLWCGWACPQTLLMEMVFRRLEYLLEGDPMSQRAAAHPPWTLRKLSRKALKHLTFLGLSFVVGNTLLSYIIGSDRLIQIITDPPARHLQGLTFMVLFTLLFYSIFARFREQACTFICPYGRFQSTLVDENTIVVAYNHKRGERRGHRHAKQSWGEREAEGYGDCIDCHQCVAVCPTGIDIRNGTQMECVHCTACIDACDDIMDRIHRPRGLIGYASLNGIERGEKIRVTPRLVGYAAILLALGGLLTFLLLTRPEVEASLLRAPGGLFQSTPEGKINNLYLLKLVNKTSRVVSAELKLEDVAGAITVLGGGLTVPAESLTESSVLVEFPAQRLHGAKTAITLGVYAAGRKLDTIHTTFIGPDPDTGPAPSTK